MFRRVPPVRPDRQRQNKPPGKPVDKTACGQQGNNIIGVFVLPFLGTPINVLFLAGACHARHFCFK